MFDFVFKYQGYEQRLIDTIKYAIDIYGRNKTFVYTYKHTVYRIPYNQICYIEKEPNKCVILFCTFLMLFDIIGYDEVIQRIHMNMENNYKDAA